VPDSVQSLDTEYKSIAAATAGVVPEFDIREEPEPTQIAI